MRDPSEGAQLVTSVTKGDGLFIEKNVPAKKGKAGGRNVDDESPVGMFLRQTQIDATNAFLAKIDALVFLKQDENFATKTFDEADIKSLWKISL